MNLLVDRHHAGLYRSLQLLFEDRLDVALFTPVGHEWWDEKFWRFGQVFGDDRLAQQYLVTEGHGWSEGPPGNFITQDVEYPGHDIFGVTLAQAREMDWWGAMATVQENQYGFQRFAEQQGARYLYQVGNTRQDVQWQLEPLALVSAEGAIPEGATAVRYLQEFDTSVWRPYDTALAQPRRIASFVNSLPLMPAEWGRFLAARLRLPEYEFLCHGHHGTDERVVPNTRIAEVMAECAFGWQDKPTGDGFGHVIFGWAAVGRPLIGTARFYEGQLAEPLWDDGVTSINLDGLSADESARRIREVADDPARWESMALAMRERAAGLIDFAADAERVRALLGL